MKAKLLAQFILNQNAIMATQAEIAQGLNSLSSQVDRIGREGTAWASQIQTLTQQVADLQTAINNQSNVSPELQAAFDAISQSVAAAGAVFP